MSWYPMVQSLALLAAANTAPLIAERIFRDRFNRPLDFGVVLGDRQPLFGRSKTIRGIAAALFLTVAIGVIAGVSLEISLAVGAFAMIGDVLSSFIKRRLRIPPSGRAVALDQVPESVLPLLICRRALGLTMGEVTIVALAFFVGEVLLARLFFRLHWRDRPY